MKIIAYTIVYNEEGVIKKCIVNAKEQGLDVIVIDNGCTDSTMEIVKKLGVPVLEHKTEKYDVVEIHKWAISLVKIIGCDWYTIKDADEMFETYDGRTIAEAVNEANDLGYNCMRFDIYDFMPTVDDDLNVEGFTERIQYYSYVNSRRPTMIKNSPEIYGGNTHRTEGIVKESPNRLILRHYKFTSLEQGRRKVKSRLNRYLSARGGLHRQYRHFTDESKFYVLEKDDYSKLHKFDGTWVKERDDVGGRR